MRGKGLAREGKRGPPKERGKWGRFPVLELKVVCSGELSITRIYWEGMKVTIEKGEDGEGDEWAGYSAEEKGAYLMREKNHS